MLEKLLERIENTQLYRLLSLVVPPSLDTEQDVSGLAAVALQSVHM